ncbi:MAG: hypothetical protein LUG60_12980 [Erysipelotrichaceae bacterium]|nr:hypothetical protein [Erysipelotrichaceae bacterium]
MNNDNLKPYKKGEERAKINGRKGGLKSVEVRRKKKAMKELAKAFNTIALEDVEIIIDDFTLNQH